jgi:hypothetical protein
MQHNGMPGGCRPVFPGRRNAQIEHIFKEMTVLQTASPTPRAALGTELVIDGGYIAQ